MKTMSMYRSLGYAAVVTVLIGGCKGGDYPGYERSATGLYSKFYVTNEGARKPKTGEYAAISVKYVTEKDSEIFNSSAIKEAEGGIITQPIFASTFKGSFEEGLMSMAQGDSASFKISADSVYMKTFGLKELPPYIKKGSMLTFYVKMHGVKTQQEILNDLSIKEGKQRNEFLKQNNITAEPTETGLYIIEKEAGNGEIIKAGQMAKIKYTGKFLNGNVFDASDMHEGKPFELTVGKGQVIPGWDEALQKMKKGEKAMLVIPSSLGYGSQGFQTIPPYSSLVFDIEVVDVK
ncbi:MAG: FKBP-type peptidyl-prolyl cis-trans isomerase [Bacteroidetes bacterium]|nr:FKBP-type peptidyl-prolyl cis-trans isomerase [Bacteroidota bacterium]